MCDCVDSNSDNSTILNSYNYECIILLFFSHVTCERLIYENYCASGNTI